MTKFVEVLLPGMNRSIVFTALVTSVITAFVTSAFVISSFPKTQQGFLPQSLTENVNEPASTHEAVIEQVVAKAAPSVVSVVATKDLPVIERYYTNPFGNDDFFNQFFPQLQIPQYRQNGTERKEVAGGTGFVVSSDGFVLTNRHVVNIKDADFTVVFSDGTREDAELIAKDPVEDLAVLRIQRTGLQPIPLGDSDAVVIGQSVIAIGNTLGEFQNTVSVGVVSGLARRLIAGGGGESEVIENAIQTDAAINPGNSGGPLLNLRGEAIGVSTAIVVGSQNVGFAIPINKAKKALGDVEATGKITHAYLGVRHVPVSKEIQEARDLPYDYGALVIGSEDGREPGVDPKSPAVKAGLREGDVLLSVNGERVDEAHSLTSLVIKHQVGEKVALRVYSQGSERDISVVLAERTE